MITIYQIHLNDSDIIAINARGWDASPKINAYAKLSNWGHKKWKPEHMEYYELTYEVDTDDLDKAFEYTNLWENWKVRRITSGHSSSVGDIFVKDGDCYIVDRFGFTNIGKFEGFN